MARRGRVVLQAESLINDGTALVVYALALGMATGQLEPTLGTAAERFAVSFGGGIVVGLVVGWAMFWVRRGLSDPLLMNVGSVLTPFAAYLLAEAVHASGVLAVVVSGLYMARVAPRTVPGSARQQGAAFWTLTTFVLNGALFVLVGMQLPSSVVGLTTDTVAHALLLVAAAYVAMVVARYVFLNVSIGIIRLLDRRPKQRLLRTTHRGRIVSTLAGFRGAVSLAVALSVPETLASRDVIVFITGTVVVASLVIQGFLLPRAIPWARLPADTSVSDELRIARVTATEEALDALPELARARGVPDEIVERFQGEYGEKLDALRSDEADAPAAARLEAQRDLALALIAQKRATVVRLRDEGTIDDTVLRQIQAQLDAEEIRLVGPATEE